MLPAGARRALLTYGARNEVAGKETKANGEQEKSGVLETLLAKLAKYTEIPHSAFWHFYVLSATCSALWAWQFVTKGTLMRFLVEKQITIAGSSLPSSNAAKAADLGRVFAAWAMLALQGLRRLYECMYVLKAGKSGMLLAHWLVGVVFYLLMSVAVWIDHAGKLCCVLMVKQLAHTRRSQTDIILEYWKTGLSASMVVPGLPVSAALFGYAWLKQLECHNHLASLKKYTLPSDGWFQNIVCPHYTSECLLYFAISLVAARPGKLVNATVLAGLAFAAANLGVTAVGTKQWSAEKFGKDKVEMKWAMIPYLV